jgi:hypothetical protein
VSDSDSFHSPSDYTRRRSAFTIAQSLLPEEATPEQIITLAAQLDKYFVTGEVA